MPRTKLSIGLDGSTFKILYVYYCAYLVGKPIGMSLFYGLNRPIEYIGWQLSKSFTYLRSHGLIQRVRWGRYTITEKGIQVLYDTLLKRQKHGLTYKVNGICLLADPDTKQIIVKSGN